MTMKSELNAHVTTAPAAAPGVAGTATMIYAPIEIKTQYKGVIRAPIENDLARHIYVAVRKYWHDLPMVDRVTCVLMWHSIEYAPHEPRWIDISLLRELCKNSGYQNVVGCTLDTAIKRLMRQSKIERRLQSRGWYKWYEYRIKEA